MADHRLFVGEKTSGKYLCVAKSYGEWRGMNVLTAAAVSYLLKYDYLGAISGETQLVFFTDGSETHKHFVEIGKDITPPKFSD